MAEDTRDSSKPPSSTSTGVTSPKDNAKNYEVYNAPASANALPAGSGLNTAGAHIDNPTLVDAVKTVRMGDFKQVYMYPCARESFLNGIGGGFAIGGIRLLFGGMCGLDMVIVVWLTLYSPNIQSLQLGCRDVLFRWSCHLRILYAKEAFGKG
jgi:hypothetical protein